MLLKSFTSKQGQTPTIHTFLEHKKNKNDAGREEQSKKTCHLNPVFMTYKGIFSSHNKRIVTNSCHVWLFLLPCSQGRSCMSSTFSVFLCQFCTQSCSGSMQKEQIEEVCCEREVSNATFSFVLNLLLLCEARVWCRVHKDTFLIGALLKIWEQRLGAEKLCAVWTFLADL